MKLSLFLFLIMGLTAAETTAQQGEATAIKEQIDSETRSRETLKEGIEKTRKEIERLRTRAGRATENIALAQRQLNLTQRYVNRLKKDSDITEARVDSVENAIDRLNLQISVSSGRLDRRLRQIYRLGRSGTFELLTSAGSLNDAYKINKYLSLIAMSDKQLVEDIKSDRRELESALADLDLLKENNKKLLNEKESETLRLQKERRRHRQLLGQVNTQRKAHMASLKEKEEALQALENLIAELERKRRAALEEARRRRAAVPRPASEFEELKGKLPWPVEGRIASRFGIKRHPRFGTAIVNRGLDIAAPAGSQVLAVDRGTVVMAQWFLSFGMMVILDHGGGYYTIYSHLAEIFVSFGAQVQSGERIGTVGDTGSLEGPILHFEILQKQDPVDPQQWLISR
jgi:septal ring factor EnvC (AmiA/AmiB activator)